MKDVLIPRPALRSRRSTILMSSENVEPDRVLNHCRNFSLAPSKNVEFIVLLNDERIVKEGGDKTFFLLRRYPAQRGNHFSLDPANMMRRTLVPS